MLKFMRSAVQEAMERMRHGHGHGHPAQGHPAQGHQQAHGELELLLPNLRGGYVHQNIKANTSLNNYLAGATTALYVMPGWELPWLYLKENGNHPPADAKRRTIHVGEYRYQIIGTKHDIKELLKQRKDQKITGSRTTTQVGGGEACYVPDPHNRNRLAESEQEKYFFGDPNEGKTRQMQNVWLKWEAFEMPKSPMTLAREAMLAMGANFIGMGGDVTSAVSTVTGLADTIAGFLAELGGADLRGAAYSFMGHGEKWVLDLSAHPVPGENCVKMDDPISFEWLYSHVPL